MLLNEFKLDINAGTLKLWRKAGQSCKKHFAGEVIERKNLYTWLESKNFATGKSIKSHLAYCLYSSETYLTCDIDVTQADVSTWHTNHSNHDFNSLAAVYNDVLQRTRSERPRFSRCYVLIKSFDSALPCTGRLVWRSWFNGWAASVTLEWTSLWQIQSGMPRETRSRLLMNTVIVSSFITSWLAPSLQQLKTWRIFYLDELNSYARIINQLHSCSRQPKGYIIRVMIS